MTNLQWKRWPEVVQLREDLRAGELPPNKFAADLYDVLTENADSLYCRPESFFALHCNTRGIRQLARDVVLRLAGRDDQAVRHFGRTYGGGKTHALLTLYHLLSNTEALPQDLDAVRELLDEIGLPLPRTRVAAVPFNKLDLATGIEVRDPRGVRRRLIFPWSAIAYQLAGDEGLRRLNGHGTTEERATVPAEPLLREVLALPRAEGRATLILLDEILWYANERTRDDPLWEQSLANFFQGLTEAAGNVPGCAIVASLLTAKLGQDHGLGLSVAQTLVNTFRRVSQGTIEPVGSADLALVLRRRLFTLESVKDSGRWRSHARAAVRGISALDESAQQDRAAVEERFERSYPFHPDLIQVLREKWSQLSTFQENRGVLRTFALALRQAAVWDDSPVIGPAAFLGAEDSEELSEGLAELADVASDEEYEGGRPEWKRILEGELEKARRVQKAEFAALEHRELEQAVVATFLHSLPLGNDAPRRDLLVLLGATSPDRILLEQALSRWADLSWYLDETPLPERWRLGPQPNLQHLHYSARQGIAADAVELKLEEEIRAMGSLTDGARSAGAIPHNFDPHLRPRGVDDDERFHYVVLGPRAASEAGKPSPEARRFLVETTGPDAPRTHNKNAVVLAVPSKDMLERAREAIRDWLAWEKVEARLKREAAAGGSTLELADPIRSRMLKKQLEDAPAEARQAIREAYCIAVTVGSRNEVEAYKIALDERRPLFEQIKADPRLRIREKPIEVTALLPEGPYNLWRDGDTSRKVSYLVGAFAEEARLPKVIRFRPILDTLLQGCRQGVLALRLTPRQGQHETYWHYLPPEVDFQALQDQVEVVLPEAAELHSLPVALLLPGEGAPPGLWPADGRPLPLAFLHAYFRGGHQVEIPKEGYSESLRVPMAAAETIDVAVREAVRQGKLWLQSEGASLCGEEVPDGLLTAGALLLPPPVVSPRDLLQDTLPEAWKEPATNGASLLDALSRKRGARMPWGVVREALLQAYKVSYVEVADGRSLREEAPGEVQLRLPGAEPRKDNGDEGGVVKRVPDTGSGLYVETELALAAIQELGDRIAAIQNVALENQVSLRYFFRVEVEGGAPPPERLAEINALLEEVSPDLRLH